MKISAEIEGIEKLKKNFVVIDQGIKNVLGKATKAGADVIRDDAKKRIHNINGDLERGVVSVSTWDKKASKAFAQVGMDKGMNNKFVVTSKVGSRYYIPSAVEYGHRAPGAMMSIETTKKGKRKKSKKQIKAYPFMRPAMKTKRSDVAKIIENHVRQAIAKGGG